MNPPSVRILPLFAVWAAMLMKIGSVSANDPPVINQGAGPLTFTVAEESGATALFNTGSKIWDKTFGGSALDWEFETGGGVGSSPAIGSDGTVYVGSYDGKLYALQTDSDGPADSPWPMFGQNAQRTGRAATQNETSSAKEQFSVNATSAPTSGGTVSGAGAYEKETSFTLEAIPADGYRFKEWTGGTFPLTTNPLTGTATNNISVTANFLPIEPEPTPAPSYSIVTTSTLDGTVTGGGIYPENAPVTITANPSPGYVFANWSEGVSGNANPLTWTVTADLNVTANFLPIQLTPAPAPSYTIVTTSTLGGTVTGGGAYPENAEVTITANPTPGYIFAKWSENASGNANPLIFTATENLSVTAVFEAIYDSPRIVGSVELVGGWWNSSWFGNFFEARSGWIYHEDQGWFFPVESGIDSYWLWDEFLGWIWTSKEVVPYFYDHDDSKWLYLGNYSSGTRVAYDFKNKTWNELPRATPKSTSTDGTQTNSDQTGAGSNSQPTAGTDFASTKTALANASGLAEAINIVNSSTEISEDSKYTIMFELTFYGESKELTQLGLSLGFK